MLASDTQNSLSVVETYDFRVPSASTNLIAGPSGSGKSVRVANILRHKNSYIKNGVNIKNVIFCYAAWQDLYDELDKENIVTQWVDQLPTNDQFIELVCPYKDNGGSICVIDDYMTEINKDLVKIVSVSSRHYNTTTFILQQSLFPANPLGRQISLNVKFIYLLKSPRDISALSFLARQIYGPQFHWVIAAYHEATKNPYSCLVLDLSQETPSELRVRSNVLPSEFPMIIWMKS